MYLEDPLLVMYHLLGVYILKILVIRSDRGLGISKKLPAYLPAMVERSKERVNLDVSSQLNW